MAFAFESAKIQSGSMGVSRMQKNDNEVELSWKKE